MNFFGVILCFTATTALALPVSDPSMRSLSDPMVPKMLMRHIAAAIIDTRDGPVQEDGYLGGLWRREAVEEDKTLGGLWKREAVEEDKTLGGLWKREAVEEDKILGGLWRRENVARAPVEEDKTLGGLWK